MKMRLHLFHRTFVWLGVLNLYLCQFRLLIQDDRLSEKSCSPLFTKSVRSFIECGVLCSSEEECLSLFYETASQQCLGCGDVYTSASDPALFVAKGTKYYRPYAFYGESCSDTQIPCFEKHTVCFPGEGKCICKHTRMYNPSTKTCVTSCDSLGDTFQYYPLRLFKHNDGWSLREPNRTACLVACTMDPDCYGIEYNFVLNKCYSNIVKVSDALSDWMSSNYHDMYLRNCK